MTRNRKMNQLTSTPMRMPNTRASWIERPPNMRSMVRARACAIMPRSDQARERTYVAHRVTFIPGDGTGPEIAEATQRVLEATGVGFDWDFQSAGADVYEEEGTP